MKFRRILEVLCLQGLQRKFWTKFHDLCVQEWSCLPWSSDRFWKFSPCKLQKRVMGAFARFLRPRMKLFALSLKAFWKFSPYEVFERNFWVHFHDLFVQKRSCLSWSLDAFWKFLACKVYRKSSGCNFTIYTCTNEGICREVQTHFGSSPLARFAGKVLGEISQFMCSKPSCLLWRSDAFWKFSTCKLYTHFLGAFACFLRPKTKLFAVKFRRIFEVLCL